MRYKQDYYSSDLKSKKIAYYAGLPEKQARHFLAMEYETYGIGSVGYLSAVFGCCPKRIARGCKELSDLRLSKQDATYLRQRKIGGGAKKKEIKQPDLCDLIIDHIGINMAGSPTDPDVKWTHLKPCDIAKYLRDTHQRSVSHRCIKRILKAKGFVKRKPLKVIETGKSPHREAQFLMILAFLKILNRMPHNPVISMDKKKTEELGNLTRNEALLCQKDAPIKTNSHDFTHLATGKAIPMGLYDTKQNKGYITLGDSRETADFIIDNLLHWWLNHGKIDYPNADTIALLCDCGGGNSYRHFRFKQRLQDLAKTIGIKIMVIYYPPYCSKYNPIEHRLFSHVARAMKDTILTDLEHMKTIIETTSTTTGLTVTVRIHEQLYEKGQISSPDLINKNRIVYAKNLPQFNFIILP
jgi:hypothetical protein